MPDLKEKARALPLKPGVYLMMDKHRQVIYVGKAKQLKNRVSQYFQDSASHGSKTRAMVSNVDDFDVIIAESEFDALVLESSLIKRHQPKYNILLKDDKGYPYIRLSKEEYPRFSIAGKLADDGAQYFGPYGRRSSSYSAIDSLRLALKLPGCTRKFPRDIGKERPCLNFHLGNCYGYCRAEADQTEYQRSIEQVVKILQGKSDEVATELKSRMEEAAEALLFEKAAELRDRYNAIMNLSRRVLPTSMADTDVVGYYKGETKSCFTVMHYIGGRLFDKDWEIIDSPETDDAEAVSALVKQYFLSKGAKLVLLPIEIDDMELISQMISEARGTRVYFEAPQRGDKTKLTALANLNSRETAEQSTTAEERRNKTLEALQKLLKLESPLRRIEAFDISNTSGSDIVASMTVFINGQPLKRDYRTFIIKSTEGQDDYASMAEALQRRFTRYIEGDSSFSELPDLLLIDGGYAHAATALRTTEALGISLPIFGMVKDDSHKTRALVTPSGKEIGIQLNQAVFSVIGRIQEETHRFAIEFHRKQQSKRVRGSTLDKISGVGPARRAELLKKFKSVKAISEASVEELSQVVPSDAARNIFDFFHSEKI